ncbi:MAG: ABC transporter substrate-binding protein [Xanthobacteraceae bacterium]
MRSEPVKRRHFMALLGGATASWPRAVRAQQSVGKLPTIGVLNAAAPSVASHWFAAFVQTLRELGWMDNQNILFEVRWANGRTDRLGEIAAELVQLKVDLIFTWATQPALVAKQATSSIPIVFALATDPIGSGLVASLARPRGNATGLSVQNVDLVGKRIELLRELVPDLSRLAVIANVAQSDPAREMREVETVGHGLGFDVAVLELRRGEDIEPAFATLSHRAQALFVVGDPLTYTHRAEINGLAVGARLPAIYPNSDFVAAGGMISYGTNFPDLFRRAAHYVDKILRGAKPGDIPIEQPVKFDLAINLKTAKALGLEVPPTVLARADEVIE